MITRRMTYPVVGDPEWRDWLDLALRLDPIGPMHDAGVARPAPMRGDLLRPLVRRVQGVRPGEGVVAVRVGAAELVDVLSQILGRFDLGEVVEYEILVEAAVDSSFGGGSVVADDVIDQRVVEKLHLLECLDEAAHVMVDTLEEPGIHLHLPLEDGLHISTDVIPGWNTVVSCCQLGVLRDDPELFLTGECLLTKRVPTCTELALVFAGPFLRYLVRRVGGARSEVDEEELVGQRRLLLHHPSDALIRHVLGEVMAFFGCLRRLDRRRVAVDRRIPLVSPPMKP
jgi:hypothetical protein